MIIKNSVKQGLRTPYTNVLAIILLSLASVFMFLSIGTWLTAQKSIKNADESFTSIAVLNENTYRKNNYISDEDKNTMYNTITGIYDTAKISSYIDSTDDRRPCMAYCKDIETVTSSMYGVEDNYPYINYPYNYVVLIGECVSVNFQLSSAKYFPDSTMLYVGYEVTIKIDKENSPLLSKDCSYEYVTVSHGYYDGDLDGFFRVGEKYIVYGDISYVSEYFADEYYPSLYFADASDLDMGRIDIRSNVDSVEIDEDTINALGMPADLKINRVDILDCYYWQYNNDDSQYAKIEGSVDDFLASEKGVKWSNIINECEVTTKSLMMRLTYNLDSILVFNQDMANIVEGRTFTDEEYSAGSKVCIISSEIAEYNGIEIGDMLDLSFWHNGFNLTETRGSTFWHQEAYESGCGFFAEAEYKVIGIYTSKNPWDLGDMYIRPNTIFAPGNSMTVEYDLVMPTLYLIWDFDEEGVFLGDRAVYHISAPNMRSYIVKNGYIDEFEAEMEASGYGGMFSYYDQGYSMIEPILQSLNGSSRLIMYISIAVWVIVLAAFFAIVISKNRKTAGTMVSLGAGKSKVFLHIFTSFLLITLASSVISGCIGYALYDKVIDSSYKEAKEVSANMAYSDFKTETSLSGTYDASVIESFDLTRSPEVIIWIALIQISAVMLIAGILSHIVADRDPMYLVKGITVKKKGLRGKRG
jgi:hypothetical protein